MIPQVGARAQALRKTTAHPASTAGQAFPVHAL